MNELSIEIDQCNSILENLQSFVENNGYLETDEYNHFFGFLVENIKEPWIREYIIESLEPIADEIASNAFELDDHKKPHVIVEEILSKIKIQINKFEYRFGLFYSNNKKATNSLLFYENKISELKKELELSEAKDGLIKAKLIEYEKKLELKQKEIDAKTDWESKITDTFENLKGYLEPIKSEKKRLNALYWFYLVSSLVLVLIVLVLEFIAMHKLTSQSGFPSFKEYITLFLPLPVLGGLIWGFIFQMNRAQRQLVVLAKNIHSIEYVQGMLLSVNKLAPTIENGINRVNDALDKLIKIHLNEKGINNEVEILKEESKDNLPIDAVLKIIKEVKTIVSK